MPLLQKAIRLVVIVALLFGMGGFGMTASAPDHHAPLKIAADSHQAIHHDADADAGSMPSEHAPQSEFGCCHSLACTGVAIFAVNTAAIINRLGQKIPMAALATATGQPVSPSKHPPKFTA